jgi:hypothetical protein
MKNKNHRNSFTLRNKIDTGHCEHTVNINHCDIRGKTVLVTEQHIMMYWGEGDMAPRIPNLCTRLHRVQGEIDTEVVKYTSSDY